MDPSVLTLLNLLKIPEAQWEQATTLERLWVLKRAKDASLPMLAAWQQQYRSQDHKIAKEQYVQQLFSVYYALKEALINHHQAEQRALASAATLPADAPLTLLETLEQSWQAAQQDLSGWFDFLQRFQPNPKHVQTANNFYMRKFCQPKTHDKPATAESYAIWLFSCLTHPVLKSQFLGRYWQKWPEKLLAKIDAMDAAVTGHRAEIYDFFYQKFLQTWPAELAKEGERQAHKLFISMQAALGLNQPEAVDKVNHSTMRCTTESSQSETSQSFGHTTDEFSVNDQTTCADHSSLTMQTELTGSRNTIGSIANEDATTIVEATFDCFDASMLSVLPLDFSYDFEGDGLALSDNQASEQTELPPQTTESTSIKACSETAVVVWTPPAAVSVPVGYPPQYSFNQACASFLPIFGQMNRFTPITGLNGRPLKTQPTTKLC